MKEPEESRQHEAHAHGVAPLVDHDAAEKEELFVAIDRSVQHFTRIGGRLGASRDDPVERVTEARDHRERSPEAEVTEGERDACADPEQERGDADAVGRGAEGHEASPDVIERPVAHLHQGATHEGAALIALHTLEVRRPFEDHTDPVKEPDDRQKREHPDRTGKIHESGTERK